MGDLENVDCELLVLERALSILDGWMNGWMNG